MKRAHEKKRILIYLDQTAAYMSAVSLSSPWMCMPSVKHKIVSCAHYTCLKQKRHDSIDHCANLAAHRITDNKLSHDVPCLTVLMLCRHWNHSTWSTKMYGAVPVNHNTVVTMPSRLCWLALNPSMKLTSIMLLA